MLLARRVALSVSVLLSLGALAAPAAAETITVGRPDLSEVSSIKSGFCEAACAATFAQRQPSTGNLVTIPSSGVVTSWGARGGLILGGGGQNSWELRILRPVGDSLLAVASSPPAGVLEVQGGQIPLASPLPVQAGDRIGVTIRTTGGGPGAGLFIKAAEPTEVPGAFFDFLGDLPDGSSKRLETTAEGQLLLNAQVSLDPPPLPPPPDTLPPVIDSIAITPAKFTAANTGPALVSAVGGTVFYKLSEAATTALTVERGRPGFKSGKRCVKTKPKGKAKPRRCTRYAAMKPSLSHSGAAGANSVRFMGRLGNRALKPGRYRLSATATDAAGNRSKARTASFRIVG